MSTLTVTVGGSAVTIQENTLKITSRVDDKDKAVFTIKDDSGILIFQKGQTVKIADSVQGTLFSGYINKPTCTNLFPSATNMWSVDCVNHFYVAAKKATSRSTTTGKRHRGGKHTNQHAGPIAALQIQEYLAPSGVSGNFGLDWTELQSNWQAGTLTGTAAATNASTGNVGAGDLELAPAGAGVTHTEQFTSDFAAGTLSSVVASNNSLVLNSRQGIAISATCTAQVANCYNYYHIWTGSYNIVSGDTLQYTIWINGTSAAIIAGIDGVCTDGTAFRKQTSIVDQNGFQIDPFANLSGWANNQWYSRQFDLSSLAGKTLATFDVVFEGNAAGNYIAYFYGISVVNSGTTNLTIYNGGALNTSAPSSNVGYTNFQISTPLVYDQSGYRISPGVSIAGVGNVLNSQINYTTTTPANSSAVVNTSIDNGKTWQPATSMNAIPSLFAGDNGSGINILTQQILSTTGTDPISTPAVTNINWTVNPAYSAIKTDVLSGYVSSGDFGGGTYTNTAFNNSLPNPLFFQNGATGGVVLNGAWKNWRIQNDVSGQALFGASSPAHTEFQGYLQLTSGTTVDDVRSELLFAGQWQNFTASIDAQVPLTSSSESVGLCYRTTNWVNQNNCGGWQVDLFNNAIKLGYGTNSGTSGSYTNIAAPSVSLNPGDWHTLTIIVNGTNHQVYLDGTQYINVTNSTYNFAGYMGMRAYNSTGSTNNYYFKQFGVVASLAGSWTTPSINLNSVGTVGSSVVSWQQPTLPASCSLVCQASVDGGATYQTVGNGGSIPQLPIGTSVTGVSLLLKFLFATGSAVSTPVLNAASVLVSAQYNGSGNRTNAPLASDTAYRLNVGSGFGTSFTGMTYTQVGTATTNLTSNELQITNATGDVHMVAGSATGTDEDGTVRFSLSASTISAGLELRYGSGGFYRLSVSTTALTLVKKSGSIFITLATASMALTTSTFYYLRFRVTGSSPVSLFARVWLAGTVEPTTWNVTGVD